MTSALRARRRDTARREIVEAARTIVDENGPAGLSLRAVARAVGMTPPALHHYFPRRDDLITALIADSYADLADTVEESIGGADDGFLAAVHGFRRWALDHTGRFELLYGTPFRQFAAPVEGPTTQSARRVATVFVQELFRDVGEEQLSSVDVGPVDPAFLLRLGAAPLAAHPLPAPAMVLFVGVWGQVHGLVALEAFGHTDFLRPLQDGLFEAAVRNVLSDARRRIGATPSSSPGSPS